MAMLSDLDNYSLTHLLYEDKLEALHDYVSRGSCFEVQSLLNEGVDPDGKGLDGKTPLMLAAELSRKEVFELLHKSGADLHCCDGKEWTLLHYAAFGGSVGIVEFLVSEGFDVDKKNFDGETALMLAAGGSHKEVVELLIDSGADVHCCDNGGWTLLHHAAIGESVEIGQCLVNKGVALDKMEANGKTPLHLAVEFFRIEFADYLLKAGADCNLEDNEGESPFNFLVKGKQLNVETVKLCIEKGAYVKSTDYNKLLRKPLLRMGILQDVKLCSQAVINKFNNRDVPLLYKGLASLKKLPDIDEMKIVNGSKMALGVEQAVTHVIRAKGFCNLLQMVPLVLGILCINSAIENLIPTFNQEIPLEAHNALQRLGYLCKQEYYWKSMRYWMK